ncbi:MAG: type III-B CRISPR module RAMP protein Cmr4 [Moorellales bacterium]
MNAAIIGLVAETSIHVGSGQAAGAIDLPVAREKTTDYPVIPGSGLKGALRERAEEAWGLEDRRVLQVFGEPERAGDVSFSDARLLLLPVRSLQGHFRWVTCPYILERYRRDCVLAERPLPEFRLAEIENGAALADETETLFLEELTFSARAFDLSAVVSTLEPLVYHPELRLRLRRRLVIVNDHEFSYFARYGLPVDARNVLDDETKTSRNLWYEEVVPPDTVFYALLLARPDRREALKQLRALFDERPHVRVGGNETVGQGWCAVSWWGSGGEEG